MGCVNVVFVHGMSGDDLVRVEGDGTLLGGPAVSFQAGTFGPLGPWGPAPRSLYSVTRCPQVTGVYFGVCVAPPVGRVALDVGALRGCMCLLWIRRRGQAQREACAQLSVWMRLREGRVILLQVVGWRGPGGQCPPPAASLPSLPLACCVSSASNLADRPSRGLAPECPCGYRLREVVDVRRWGAPDGTGPGRPWIAY